MKLVINIQDEKLLYEFNDENTNNYTIDTFCSVENKSISSYIIIILSKNNLRLISCINIFQMAQFVSL